MPLNESEKDVLQGMNIIVLVLHHVILKQWVWGAGAGGGTGCIVLLQESY